ncbi:putative serine aminopeptidase, S33, alpha/Beta hydrolase [Rosa chinensis]|uniref:Putative serine aminopeptidase, S33, alpha/Beta hydrolase n=1 Tax=Rosa chinensis TaxID=74649 RepID=A0A2P6P237_ROSCH|nr:uncharacterized protein LOC112176979 [Rosa chinensis]PRQ15991.1 putative serine aminopeptidase, S33, alpha/Beta hydrolase [Rosa chinensis]
MSFLVPGSYLRSLATAFGTDRYYFSPVRFPEPLRVSSRRSPANGVALGLDKRNDPRWSVCTADELHFVSVPDSDWNLALWRYLPSPQSEPRNHPLLLLSGVATNAIGFDLSPEFSFARSMSAQGYDTWILEVRGAGLSTHGTDSGEVNGLLEAGQNHATQIGGLSQTPLNIMEVGQRAVTSFADFQERFSTTLEDFQKQLDLVAKLDWDFDHYLEEDVPVAMEYIRTQCKPEDGKLLAIGHSMGGILLYAMLSRCSSQGQDSGFASVVTLGSSLDYRPSKSSLKLFLPLADPAQVVNVPVPFGAIYTAVHHLVSGTPVLSWLKPQVSAQDLMDPELYEKLILNNFGTVPAKLLLQLATVFQEGGLRDRSGTFFYKEHLCKSNVPILALGGDQDLICPPEAVYETVKVIPEQLVTFKVLGELGGPHYAHYDLVGGRGAAGVYPHIIEFLNRHDRA